MLDAGLVTASCDGAARRAKPQAEGEAGFPTHLTSSPSPSPLPLPLPKTGIIHRSPPVPGSGVRGPGCGHRAARPPCRPSSLVAGPPPTRSEEHPRPPTSTSVILSARSARRIPRSKSAVPISRSIRRSEGILRPDGLRMTLGFGGCEVRARRGAALGTEPLARNRAIGESDAASTRPLPGAVPAGAPYHNVGTQENRPAGRR